MGCWVAVNVYLPKDRVTNNHQGYGFVEFRTEEDADYVSLPASQHLLVLKRLSAAGVDSEKVTVVSGKPGGLGQRGLSNAACRLHDFVLGLVILRSWPCLLISVLDHLPSRPRSWIGLYVI